VCNRPSTKGSKIQRKEFGSEESEKALRGLRKKREGKTIPRGMSDVLGKGEDAFAGIARGPWSLGSGLCWHQGGQQSAGPWGEVWLWRHVTGLQKGQSPVTIYSPKAAHLTVRTQSVLQLPGVPKPWRVPWGSLREVPSLSLATSLCLLLTLDLSQCQQRGVSTPGSQPQPDTVKISSRQGAVQLLQQSIPTPKLWS
jgi:hypothetical protein